MDKEQRKRVDDAKNELQRRIQQMLSSGNHRVEDVKEAVTELLEGWL
jgi:uncharacterized protein YjbJ (UPF0337 family)